jgi:hypothetical protein
MATVVFTEALVTTSQAASFITKGVLQPVGSGLVA